MTLASPWTDEIVATARRMWARGYSKSEIARTLNALNSHLCAPKITPNAVSGKIRRLGLSDDGRGGLRTASKTIRSALESKSRRLRPQPSKPRSIGQ